jgi:hypothetical protein
MGLGAIGFLYLSFRFTLSSMIGDVMASEVSVVRRMQDRFDSLSRRIAEAYAEVPVEEGLAEIDVAVARERSG